MGNVEGKVGGRRHVDPPYCTSRPLPPLPRNEEQEVVNGNLDLDSPPPYPPPPPPGEENKRFSWRLRDSAVFGPSENKRRSWLLNMTNGGDKARTRLAKDGKDVHDGQVAPSGSRDAPDGGEAHLLSYSINNDNKQDLQGSGTMTWQLHDGKLVAVNSKDLVRGEDPRAPGYSVLNQCSTSTPPMTHDLKNVIEELRGNPNVDSQTRVERMDDGRGGVVTLTTTTTTRHNHTQSHSPEESLSKLEAELTALLNPELDGRGKLESTRMNGKTEVSPHASLSLS
ncbi:hypothetical protein Pcinc_034380, partial [Petrolisthes cinctipes]